MTLGRPRRGMRNRQRRELQKQIKKRVSGYRGVGTVRVLLERMRDWLGLPC